MHGGSVRLTFAHTLLSQNLVPADTATCLAWRRTESKTCDQSKVICKPLKLLVCNNVNHICTPQVFFFKWRSGPLIATASGFWHAGIPLSKSENLCCNINGSDSEIASCEWDSSSVRSTLFLLLLRPWRNAGAVVQRITCQLQISSSVKIRIIHTELVAVSTIWAWRRGLGYRIVSCSSQDKSKSMRLRNMESPVSRTKSYTISCVDYLQTRQGWADRCLPNWKETFHRSLWQWACRHMLGHHLNAGRRHFALWRSKTTVPRLQRLRMAVLKH